MKTSGGSHASASPCSPSGIPTPPPQVRVGAARCHSPPPASPQTLFKVRDDVQTRSALLSPIVHNCPDFRGLFTAPEDDDARSSVSALYSESDASGRTPASRNDNSAVFRSFARTPIEPTPGRPQVLVRSLMRPHAVALDVRPGSECVMPGAAPLFTAGGRRSRALSISSSRDSEGDVSTDPKEILAAHTALHPTPTIEEFLTHAEELEKTRALSPSPEQPTTGLFRRKGTQLFETVEASDRFSSGGPHASVPPTDDRDSRQLSLMWEELSQCSNTGTDTPLNICATSADGPSSRHSRRVMNVTMPTQPSDRDEAKEEAALDTDLNTKHSAIGGLSEVLLSDAESSIGLPRQWSFPAPARACVGPGTNPVRNTARVPSPLRHQHDLTASARGADVDSNERTNPTAHSASQGRRQRTCISSGPNLTPVSANGLPLFVPLRARPVRQSSGGAAPATGLRQAFSTPSLSEEGAVFAPEYLGDVQRQSPASLRLGRGNPQSLGDFSSPLVWPMNFSSRQTDPLTSSGLSVFQFDSTYPMMMFASRNSNALPDTGRDENDLALTDSQSVAAEAEFALRYLAQLASHAAEAGVGDVGGAAAAAAARRADPAVAITPSDAEVPVPASELAALLSGFRNLALFAGDTSDVVGVDTDKTNDVSARAHIISPRHPGSTHASTSTDRSERLFRSVYADPSLEQSMSHIENCAPLADHHHGIHTMTSESPPDSSHFPLPSATFSQKELALASVHSGVSAVGEINTAAARRSAAQHNPLMSVVGNPSRTSPTASTTSSGFAVAVPTASSFNTSGTRQNNAHLLARHPSFVGVLSEEFTNSSRASRGPMTGCKTPPVRPRVGSLVHFACGGEESPDARMPLCTRRLYASGHDSPGDAHPRRGSVSAKGTWLAPTLASKGASFRMDTGDMSPRFPLLASTTDDQSESLSARRVLATPPEYDADVPAPRHYAECSTFTLGSVDEGEFSQSVWD